MSQSVTTQLTFPVLCIPRAMLFHTAEVVEDAINQAMHGKFVKSVAQSTTTDKSGIQFNVFFIHPDQDFKANRCTDTLYNNLKTQGIVNISTGTGKYFWKVKLYVPHLKAQYLPPTEVPVPVGPRIMSVEDVEEFEMWRREKAAAKVEADKAAAEFALAQAKAAAEKATLQLLGERLYPRVVEFLAAEFPEFKLAGKVTGMLLELPHAEIETAITDPTELSTMVREGVRVLREHFLREAGAA
jgi:hypothetical protein